MRISCIHPSRSRPQKARQCYNNWIGKARGKVEYILSIDDSDDQSFRYRKTFSQEEVLVVSNPNRSIVDAVNNGAAKATGDLLIIVSDDFDCPPKWDEILTKAVEGKTDFVIRVPDGNQNWICTLPIMDRVYYNRFGYMYPPAYTHMFADTEQTAVAELLGKIIEVPVVFEHLHPMYGKAHKDHVNVRADRTFQAGLITYYERLKNNFGLKAEEIVGKIGQEGHLEWVENELKRRRVHA